MFAQRSSTNDSCLATRLSRYVALTQDEAKFVARMERDARPMTRRQSIFEIGDVTNALHVIRCGWALVYGQPVRGRRPIIHIYLPGDVIGMAELSQPHAKYASVMRTDGMICPFPRAALVRMYEEVPRLAALIMALNSLEHHGLRQRFVASTSLTAEARLLQFLVSLKNRLDATQTLATSRFFMPLTQSEIGDHLGLTSIYVNRLLKRLSDRGVLTLRDKHVQLLDMQNAPRDIDLQNEWREIDQSWFPT